MGLLRSKWSEGRGGLWRPRTQQAWRRAPRLPSRRPTSAGPVLAARVHTEPGPSRRWALRSAEAAAVRAVSSARSAAVLAPALLAGVAPLAVAAGLLLRRLLLTAAASAAAGGSRAGDERRGGGDLLPIREAQLLEGELVARVGEGEAGGGDVVGGAGKLFVQPAEEIEDELRLIDGMADVAELVGGGLDAEAVVVDGGIPLSHRVELVAQEDGPLRLVRLEETVDGDPELTSGLGGAGRGHVEDGLGNGAEDPTPDTAIRLLPGGVGGGGWSSAVDVGDDAELAAHGKEARRPPGEIAALEFQRHRHVMLHVDRGEGVDEQRADGVALCPWRGARREDG